LDDLLIIFAKAPIAGLAKTRLFPHLSFEEAAEVHRAFLSDTVDKALMMPTFDVCLAYTPVRCLDVFKQLYGPRVTDYLPQHGDDLGERMSNALDCAFDRGAGKAAIIGSDIPTLPAHYINAAFKRLDKCDLVIGPSLDGGYYLVAMKRPAPELFKGIAWSGPDVYKDTLTNAGRLGMKVEMLPLLKDIDTVEDLRGLLGTRLPPNTHRVLSGLEDRLRRQADWLL
jgi:rSAM/selenodomain-associated transferase 1